jgi:hypothetical protein
MKGDFPARQPPRGIMSTGLRDGQGIKTIRWRRSTLGILNPLSQAECLESLDFWTPCAGMGSSRHHVQETGSFGLTSAAVVRGGIDADESQELPGRLEPSGEK